MWQGLWDGVLEVAGDIGTTVTDAFVEVEKEKARQTETLKRKEPVKSTAVDGSTRVHQPKVQPPMQVMGSTNMLMLGGMALLAVFMLSRR